MASEKGYKTLKTLVEQQVAAHAGNNESKEDDRVVVNERTGEDSVLIMGSLGGIEVGQAEFDPSTPNEMAKMKRYLSTVHEGCLAAVQGSWKPPVDLPDSLGIQ